VRFVISVFALLNPGIRRFSFSHLDEALDHLPLKPTERVVAESIARRLTRAVAVAGDQRPSPSRNRG
jgi:hypothetical protein